MKFAIRSLLLALALGLVTLISVVPPQHAAAQAGLPEPDCWSIDRERYGPGPLTDDAVAWWRQQGLPVLGPEKRLANGAVWRLLVDQRTGIAVPRITWMPDREAMRRANRLFDVLHGCRLVSGAYQIAGSVALTYASSLLVSSVEVAAPHLGEINKEMPSPWGYIFDLSNRRAIPFEACGRWDMPFTIVSPFSLGDLLDTCAPGSHDHFLALWQRAVEGVTRLPAYRRETRTDGPYCQVFSSLAEPPQFALSLAPAGLAVRTAPRRRGHFPCTRANSPYDTAIIPWRELEAFLKPGPWRDELLRPR